jgi:trk system potassium uptake protein
MARLGGTRQVLVVGAGKFGTAVAAELTRQGHEVLVIDDDPEAVEAVAPFCARALELDGTDENALRDLGVTEFDDAVVAISDPARAILATLILSDLGVRHIVARAQSATEVRILERAGNVRPVLVEQAMGRYVARSLGIGGSVDLLPVSEDVVVVRIELRDEHAGRTVADVEAIRTGVSVLALQRGASVTVTPGPGMRLAAGDALVLIGRQQDLEALRLRPG